MRDEKIPIISFVANTGGLLGLCMGFSLVSVFEIVFHCGGAVKKEFIRRKRKQTTHKTEDSNHAVVQNHITGYSVREENNDVPVDNAIEHNEEINLATLANQSLASPKSNSNVNSRKNSYSLYRYDVMKTTNKN